MINNKILQVYSCIYVPDIEKVRNKLNRDPVYMIGLKFRDALRDTYNFNISGRRHSCYVTCE